MAESIAIRMVGVDLLVADIDLLAKAAERSLEIREALVECFGAGVETSGVDIQRCATPTANELWIEAKLCDRLAGFVAALRTGDVDAV